MIHTVFPAGDTLQSRVELPLASNKQGWYGNCMGDICDAQVPIQNKAMFKHAGDYTFILEQIMRQDTLKGIREIGLRLEKDVSSI
jgi:gliding motility-associated lipoprotein GldH